MSPRDFRRHVAGQWRFFSTPRDARALSAAWPFADHAMHQSGRLSRPAILIAMTNSPPAFALINLLFALITRWLGLWTHGQPPARFVALFERTERTLADAIRATLTEDGVAFPALDDRTFLKWFTTNAPSLGTAGSAGFRRQKTSRLKPALQVAAGRLSAPKCVRNAAGHEIMRAGLRNRARMRDNPPTPAPSPRAGEGNSRAPP
jgi:hypothetical protein